MRWAVAVAVAAHAGAFVVNWPSLAKASVETGQEQLVRVLRLHEFVPPPPRQPEMPRPRRTVAIPDATPLDDELLDRSRNLDPEPLPIVAEEVPVIVPPPPLATPTPAPRPVRVRAVTAPKVVRAPKPAYPKAASRVGLEGVVILECIIDTGGRVVDITVLRGAPLGLTEAAVAAVEQWVFEPSTLGGRPVEVIYVLTVSFTVARAG